MLLNKNLEKIKKRELLILKKFDNFCKNNKIEYSLAFGTLLGAIRHKGFIPWDDDIDLIMTRKDYNKFLNKRDKFTLDVLTKENKEFPNPGIFLGAKIKNIKDKGNLKCFLDIFVMDGLSEKLVPSFLQKNFYIFLRYLQNYERNPNFFSRGSCAVKSFFILFLPFREISKFIGISNFLEKIYIGVSKKYNSQYFIYWKKSLVLEEKEVNHKKK
jgi:phosphorylcholine metabolism protein LicD